MVFLPAWRRASLRRDTIEANAGEEADVPPTEVGRPPTITCRVAKSSQFELTT
jgi:hypothetical protein